MSREAEAMDLMVGDMASDLVPFPRFPCEAKKPRRDDAEILREIGEAHFNLSLAEIDGGDLTFGAELIRRLIEELVGK